MASDYYSTLGIPRDADGNALKSAFRKKAMEYHPDRNPGDKAAEAKFKEISEAYSILSDPEKRQIYDRFGAEGLKGAGQGGGFSGGAGFDDVLNGMFGDLFEDLFAGGRSGQRGPQRGADLRQDAGISLEEAFSGRSVRLDVTSSEACAPCGGSGAAPGARAETCKTCQGHGRLRVQQGFFTMERTCAACGGRGQVIRDACKTCQGRGATRRQREIDVAIPAGVEDGTRIRLSGEGDSGARGGPAGDLYLFVSVGKHDLFERDGADLYCQAPVQMTVAALGGSVEVPTIEGGRARIDIPEGAQTGRRFRLKGKGMTKLRNSGPRGDLLVEILVETPVKLTTKQKDLLRQFDRECCAESHPQSSGFFERVKRVFENGH